MILDGQSPHSIAAAAQALQRGELLGLPTETVYGLAGDACNEAAVAKIFAAKARPSDHPLIVHVASAQGVAHFAREVPEFAARLMQAFWPGPLTLILPRRVGVAAAAAGGQDSVGLRCPSHPVAQALLREAEQQGMPGLAAPSANMFGRVSPTTAAHVVDEFGPELLVLEGGACDVGIESTIVDCTRGMPVVLRPGLLTSQQLGWACGQTLKTMAELQGATDLQAPRASGTLASHYAPRAQVRLIAAHDLVTELNRWALQSPASATLALWIGAQVQLPDSCKQRVQQQVMPQDAAACAHDLFAQLRAFDAQAVTEIWIQNPPADSAWDGVRDRLMRAATPVR